MPDRVQIPSLIKPETLASPKDAVKLKDLNPSEAVVRTHAAGPQAIEGTDQPQAGSPIPELRITIPPPRAMAVSDAASQAGVGAPSRFPDFAFAVIRIAVAREAFGSQKLRFLADQVREQLGDVDLLLELSNELIVLPDKDSNEVTPKMKGLIAKLEIHKIQIWNGDKMGKEKLAEMKAQISSQIDKLRTAIQTKISTEIQPEANNLQAIMNIVQQIIQSDARLKRKTAEIPR